MPARPTLAQPKPPAQKRGRQTLQRVVEAAERLLRTHSFEDITVADIVREADASIGSFYARFESKDALLPYVYELYNADLDAEWMRIEAAGGLRGADLRHVVRAFVELSGVAIRRIRWLLKAMAIYARQHPERLPSGAIERNERIFRVAMASFTPHMTCAPAEAVRRARTITYAIITLTREHELFGAAPLAATLNADRKTFEQDLVRMATAYLASD
jgi:AcrR family transcriptional regulator